MGFRASGCKGLGFRGFRAYRLYRGFQGLRGVFVGPLSYLHSGVKTTLNPKPQTLGRACRILLFLWLSGAGFGAWRHALSVRRIGFQQD